MPLLAGRGKDTMNKFTQALWEVINEALDEDEELLADMRAMMFKEYKPFLTEEQTLQANIHALQTYILDKLNQWYQWLPDTTINQLGSELALQAFQEVYWSVLAGLLQERLATLVS